MSSIKTAILSFGMSGKVFHAPFLELHNGFQLAGAWERSKKSIQDIYPAVSSYSRMEELLSDETIDLVVVNTPTYTHYEYAKAALKANKHVIVEKAFTTTVDEAVELKALAEKMGKKIGVFQNRRWDSDFKTARKIKESGILGNVIEAELRYERFKPSIGPKLHKEDPNPGAGLLIDLGPHLIDQALCLFGMPKSLFADVRVTRPYSQVDDWFEISLQYESNRVRLKSGYFTWNPLAGFILNGTHGSFIKPRADIQETELLAGKKPNLANWGTEPLEESGWLFTGAEGNIKKERIASEQGNYYNYYDEVYKAIVNDTPMPVTCDDGINVMKLIEAARKSSAEKKVIGDW